ncbi:hypothetical protein C1H46_034311 [Malus baccata]|uniref:Uncharacterized protein n=1 Tax=Malus baccata TaxID=106549 RepID=A0A540L0U4_MALBA|nr:hypothetical protein C1H46_034311 [Malus baccata]
MGGSPGGGVAGERVREGEKGVRKQKEEREMDIGLALGRIESGKKVRILDLGSLGFERESEENGRRVKPLRRKALAVVTRRSCVGFGSRGFGV